MGYATRKQNVTPSFTSITKSRFALKNKVYSRLMIIIMVTIHSAHNVHEMSESLIPDILHDILIYS